MKNTGKHYSPETISRFKKEAYLSELLEDNFRDEVVRPMFFRKGLKDGSPHSRSKCNSSDFCWSFVAQAFSGPVVNT